MTEMDQRDFPTTTEFAPRPLEVTDSVALARLIEEVRLAATPVADKTAYNRTYHRHNR